MKRAIFVLETGLALVGRPAPVMARNVIRCMLEAASAVAIWLAVAGLIVGFSVAVLVIRSITRSLAGMVTMIQEIAANNLGIDDMHVGTITI